VGIALGGIIFEVVMFPSVSTLASANPPTTSMIETRLREARTNGGEAKRAQIWVPLEKISPNLQRAVLAGEDTNFATHHGFDYEAIQKAWEQIRSEIRTVNQQLKRASIPELRLETEEGTEESGVDRE